MGLWGYWAIGLMGFFEAFALTSVFSPGTVVVVLGGALAAQGIYNIGLMMCFVAVGTVLGSQASFWLGTRGEELIGTRWRILSPENLDRGRRFFAKYGGASIVIGHFLGPLRPIAPVVAGLSAMDRRRFLFWNVAGGVAYAVVMVSVGYFFGTAFSLYGVLTPRMKWITGAGLAVLLALVVLIARARQSKPFRPSRVGSAANSVRDDPPLRAFFARYPGLWHFLAHRVSRQNFTGLPATLFGLAFLYFLILYAGSVLDLPGKAAVVSTDARLAELIYVGRSERLSRFFTLVTGLGHWRAIVILALAASGMFWVWDRRAYIPALWVALTGNVITVSLLKLAFARARPDFALYVENSYAFPSGHSAAITVLSVFLTWVLVRERRGHDLLWRLCCFTLVFLVGVSRLYLGEHFLSDVLNGILVGALWASAGIFLAGRWHLRWPPSERRATRTRLWGMTAGISAAATIALGVVVADYSRSLRRAPPPTQASPDMPADRSLGQGEWTQRSDPNPNAGSNPK